MKKIIYILSVISLFVACSKGFEIPEENSNIPEGNEYVQLDFSVPYDMATKAGMTLVPSIDPTTSTMHVLVFNARTGALIQAEKAELTDKIEARGETNKAKYKVLVKLGSGPRNLHFIVDAPTYKIPDNGDSDETGLGYAATKTTEAVKVMIGDSESEVAKKLYTKEGVTAYWQRVKLPQGILPYQYAGGKNKYNEGLTEDGKSAPITDASTHYVDHNGKIVNVDDYIDAKGNKIVNNTGYIASQAVQDATENIALIRNFLTITLESKNSNIKILQAGLVNHPRAGYIAPYNMEKNSFVDGFSLANLTSKTLDAEAIKSSGYNAPVPSIIIKKEVEGKVVDSDESLYTELSDVKYTNADQSGKVTLFTYERGIPESNPTAILVQVNMPVPTEIDESGKADRWLKIDLMDDNGSYLALFRNFLYPFELNSITGSNGYGTANEAFNNPSIGDISASPETQNLTQISDGKGLNLWVDFADYTHVGESTTINLRYKFWYNNQNLSDRVHLDLSHETSDHAVKSNTTNEEYSGTDTQDGSSGWYYTKVTLNGSPKVGVNKSTIRVSGTYEERTLYKDVVFNVRAVTDFTVDAAQSGSNVTVTIDLPPLLGYSVFPLVISIEDYYNNINPDEEEIPVTTGSSLFSGLNTDDVYYKPSDTNSFSFQKTINFSEYDKNKGTTYTVKFKKVVAATQTVIIAKDNKNIFNLTTPKVAK